MEKENVGVHVTTPLDATRKSLSSLTAEHAILQEQLDVLAEERDAAHAALAREQASAARRRRAHEDGLASARAAADEARASVCGLEAELHAEALRREENNEVAIVPILLYDVNLKVDCPELNRFSPLPAWDKCWRDFEMGDGEYQDAHKLIRDGLREAIDKARGSGQRR